ncbi:MAG: VOC family protein [Solirubrobacterales bacterium]|nr:VOC family protein [Solirubrobacterales bacterium]
MALWNARLREIVLASPVAERAAPYWAALLGGRVASDRIELGDDTGIRVVDGSECGLVEARFDAGPETIARAQQLAAGQDGTSLVVTDPDGWRLRLDPVDVVRPMKLPEATLSHCTLMSETPMQQRAYYEKAGFLLSDALGDIFCWLRPNPVHHTMAFVTGPAVGINHLAVELPDAGSLIGAVDRVVAEGGTIEFGPGRHIFGGNLFAYLIDAHGLRWELCAELERREPDSPPGLHTAEARARSINLFGPRPPASFLEVAGGPGPVAAA